MTDPGLNDRLRQKSRRAGLAVGLTMALTIALCIGGATAIYAALIQPLSDLIPVTAPEAPAAPEPAGSSSGAADLAGNQPVESAESRSAQAGTVGEPTPAPAAQEPAPPPPDPEPTATPAPAFEPTHQIGAAQSVNFRSGPSRNDPIIVALSPSTPLAYLNEEAPTQDGADGSRWMKFETESGEVGWVREIDIVPYEP